jgi:hypothetical protein
VRSQNRVAHGLFALTFGFTECISVSHVRHFDRVFGESVVKARELCAQLRKNALKACRNRRIKRQNRLENGSFVGAK